MPMSLTVKPTHKPVRDYYAALQAYADQDVDHEGAVRSAFQNLALPQNLWVLPEALKPRGARPQAACVPPYRPSPARFARLGERRPTGSRAAG